jgi:hypothetical protein
MDDHPKPSRIDMMKQDPKDHTYNFFDLLTPPLTLGINFRCRTKRAKEKMDLLTSPLTLGIN